MASCPVLPGPAPGFAVHLRAEEMLRNGTPRKSGTGTCTRSGALPPAHTCPCALHRGEMSGVRPVSRDILMETLLYEQLLEPLTMEVLGVTDPEEDLDPMEDFDPLECMEDSDMLALRLACIGDEMDVSLRAPRLAQLSEVAMHSLGLAFISDQTDIRDVLTSFMDGFTSLKENIMRFWRSLNPGSRVSREQVLLALLLLLLALLSGGLHLLLK
ncbi:bcl-2-interacting killer isoform X1 [Trachypithecus francoisi]|uniref:bcl-2-interacting killer isoform X1 n=2 Tax=Trachypithecus francoisi TaxID=54180 RepID=UPI00141B92F4|nr:bcl-2-interacting killer isoform X1 [Trachypithecus francoisi]